MLHSVQQYFLHCHRITGLATSPALPAFLGYRKETGENRIECNTFDRENKLNQLQLNSNLKRRALLALPIWQLLPKESFGSFGKGQQMN